MFVVLLTVCACQRSTRFGRRHFPFVTMISPPNVDIAVRTNTRFATKANPRLLYIVLFRRSVFKLFIQIPSFQPLSRSFAQITSIFFALLFPIQQTQWSLPVLPQSRAIYAENHPPKTI